MDLLIISFLLVCVILSKVHLKYYFFFENFPVLFTLFFLPVHIGFSLASASALNLQRVQLVVSGPRGQ